jgi:alginate O-acetyltransferase complex protein AlgJ
MKTQRRTGSGSDRGLGLWFDFKKNSGLPLLFLVLISLPLLAQLFTTGRGSPLQEKRKLADKPRFSLLRPLGYLREYESYFNDNFPFRGALVFCHNWVQVMVFATSPLDKVVIGREGWLFLGRESKFRNEIEYFRSARLFSAAELERWRAVFQQRRQWFRRHGIFYIFMVIPNKSTIFPEYLPPGVHKANAQSRLDQLLAALRRDDPDFPVLDLREVMLREKGNLALFYHTDTHWTELGAYLAYRAIMEKLATAFPEARAAALDQFTVERGSSFSGDLALMLALPNDRFRETAIRLRAKAPEPPSRSSAKRKLGPFTREIISECPGGKLPTALIEHDSFMHQLKPFFRPQFRRIVYIWDWWLHFFPQEIAREKPGIVIDEMVERALGDAAPVNPAELQDLAGK